LFLRHEETANIEQPTSNIQLDDWGERARLACGFGRRARTIRQTIQFGRRVFGATPKTATGTVALPIPNAAGATGRVARPVKYGGDNGKPWRGALFHRARRTMLGDDGNQIGAHSALSIPHLNTLFLNSVWDGRLVCSSRFTPFGSLAGCAKRTPRTVSDAVIGGCPFVTFGTTPAHFGLGVAVCFREALTEPFGGYLSHSCDGK